MGLPQGSGLSQTQGSIAHDDEWLWAEAQRLKRDNELLHKQLTEAVDELQQLQNKVENRLVRQAADLTRTREDLLEEMTLRQAAQQRVVRLRSEIETTQREVIFKLSEIVETRSKETGAHVLRVAELSAHLARLCGLPQADVDLLRLAAPMHDVGKVGIPDAILLCPGKLTPDDFEVMKTHTTAGYEMLKGSSRKVLRTAALISLQHHEKYDGTGYPLGLRGEQIKLFSRITCLADVFDALSSDRPYRKAWELGRIMDYIRDQSGLSFDPHLVDVFFKHLNEFIAVRFEHDDADEQPNTAIPTLFVPACRAKTDYEPPRNDESGDDATERNPASESHDEVAAVGGILPVLLAVEDPLQRSRLVEMLNAMDCSVTETTTGTAAWTLLQTDGAPGLAILDENLPGLTGREICRLVRQNNGRRYQYVILLSDIGVSTGQADQRLLEGMQAGADMCLCNIDDNRELAAHLQAARRILNLQAELIATRESLRHRATHDSLTGLWNRPGILEMLDREIDRAKREEVAIGVIIIDVDRFKLVNDTYGHRIGDLVLRQAAHRMRTVMRPYDLVGRYGGDEFLAIVPRCDLTFAGLVAERLRAAIAGAPMQAAGKEVVLTVSAGAAAAVCCGPDSMNDIIHAADQAMYQAKSLGRNRIAMANAPTDIEKAFYSI